MSRKYADIRVLPRFYTSSSGHVFFTILWTGGSRTYCPQFAYPWSGKGYADGWSQAPAYLTTETEAAIARLLQSGDYVAYEYDRDGQQRTEGLRYWGDELKVQIIRLCAPQPRWPIAR